MKIGIFIFEYCVVYGWMWLIDAIFYMARDTASQHQVYPNEGREQTSPENDDANLFRPKFTWSCYVIL